MIAGTHCANTQTWAKCGCCLLACYFYLFRRILSVAETVCREEAKYSVLCFFLDSLSSLFWFIWSTHTVVWYYACLEQILGNVSEVYANRTILQDFQPTPSINSCEHHIPSVLICHCCVGQRKCDEHYVYLSDKDVGNSSVCPTLFEDQ